MSVDTDETWWSQFRRRIASVAGLKPNASETEQASDTSDLPQHKDVSPISPEPTSDSIATETDVAAIAPVPVAHEGTPETPSSIPETEQAAVVEQPTAEVGNHEPAETHSAVPKWRVLGTSVRGASHERSGLPNQDAIRWTPESGEVLPIILTVSDGHGSSRSFRSDQGSQFAVRAAVETLERLIDGQPDLSNHSATKRMAQESLPQDLVRTWDSFVDRALAEAPLSEVELANLEAASGASARQAVESNMRLAYGATSLSVLITDSFILYVQLGDGDILTVSNAGEVERPAPRDPRLFANETTSLCSEQAWRNVQVSFQTLAGSPPALIMLSTDGYANSFQNDDEFRRVGSDILSLLRSEGMASVSENLGLWLNEATLAGSGDDITVGIAYLAEAPDVPNPANADPESDFRSPDSDPSHSSNDDEGTVS